MMFGHHKLFVVSLLMAPISASCIWWLNWEYYKNQETKAGIKFSKLLLIFMFICDMISWPLTLIQTSKIILIHEVGDENV